MDPHSALDPGWDETARRLEELKGVFPALAELPALAPSSAPAVLRALMDSVESLRRARIRDQIQVAALQEMTESLLRSRDASAILETLVRYIRQVFNLQDALLLRRLPRNSGWVGFVAGPGGSRRIGAVAWHPNWREARLRADVGPADREPTDPESYELLLPIFGHVEAEASPEPGSSASAEPIGLLCLSHGASEVGGPEWRPDEIARHVESVLEALWHREELEAESLLRRQLLEGMRDGLVALDRDGAILASNQASSRFLNLPSRPTGESLTVEEMDAAAPHLMEHLRKALERGEEPKDQEMTLGPSEHPLPAHVAVSRLQDEDGCFAGLVVNLTDLTQIRSMEEEIRHLDRLAALGRFSAGVAHEIRNPLAGIEAGVEYLAERLGTNPHDREDLRILRAEIARLNRIVSELLDYTRPRPLQPQGVKVREIIERTTLAIAPIFAAQQQELCLDGPQDLVIWADPDRLEQVLINLTKNASEASSRRGVIRLSWATRGVPSAEAYGVVFRVEDAGAGMAPEERTRAFEPFYTTKGNGSGLGLSLSHTIAEQHGGRLHLESTPGRGTTAVLELPPGNPEPMETHAIIHSRG